MSQMKGSQLWAWPFHAVRWWERGVSSLGKHTSALSVQGSMYFSIVCADHYVLRGKIQWLVSSHGDLMSLFMCTSPEIHLLPCFATSHCFSVLAHCFLFLSTWLNLLLNPHQLLHLPWTHTESNNQIWCNSLFFLHSLYWLVFLK